MCGDRNQLVQPSKLVHFIVSFINKSLFHLLNFWFVSVSVFVFRTTFTLLLTFAMYIYWIPSVLNIRDITLLTKVRIIKAMVFPVVTYGCDSWTIKKAEHQRTDAFELWCWRTPESPLDSKEIKPVNLKRDQPWIFTGRTDVEAEAQYFGHLMLTDNSLKKSLMLGKTEGRRRRGRQRMRCLEGITEWTRTWANSRRWWGTGRPGMLPSMGSQRVGHGSATEQQPLHLSYPVLFYKTNRRPDFVLKEVQGQQTLPFSLHLGLPPPPRPNSSHWKVSV